MDWTEWLYVISGFLIFVVIIVAIVAQAKVYSAYDKYSKKTSSLGLTGQMLAQKLCEQNNLALTIRSCSGKLSDHYNPKDKSINISQENFNSFRKKTSTHRQLPQLQSWRTSLVMQCKTKKNMHL